LAACVIHDDTQGGNGAAASLGLILQQRVPGAGSAPMGHLPLFFAGLQQGFARRPIKLRRN